MQQQNQQAGENNPQPNSQPSNYQQNQPMQGGGMNQMQSPQPMQQPMQQPMNPQQQPNFTGGYPQGQPAAPMQQYTPPGGVSRSDRARLLILIIEDEGLLARMYSKKLEHDGYTCMIASNGQEGLDLAGKNIPDLILCDVMMPVKDGLTVLKELKENPNTTDIPVIMLSNLSDEKYVNEALEMGAISYLIKSKLVPADVVTKIKETIVATGNQTLISKVTTPHD